jgi:hypothetical protein
MANLGKYLSRLGAFLHPTKWLNPIFFQSIIVHNLDDSFRHPVLGQAVNQKQHSPRNFGSKSKFRSQAAPQRRSKSKHGGPCRSVSCGQCTAARATRTGHKPAALGWPPSSSSFDSDRKVRAELSSPIL